MITLNPVLNGWESIFWYCLMIWLVIFFHSLPEIASYCFMCRRISLVKLSMLFDYALNLTTPICTPYSVLSTCLIDACKKAHHLINGQNEQHKMFMLVTFITTQNRSPCYGIPRQKSYHHNFMLCSMITSTQFKHPIRTSNKQTPWIVYSKQTDIYRMTLLAMNIHTYSLPGDQTYTQTT
jgi:hypothetical protein